MRAADTNALASVPIALSRLGLGCSQMGGLYRPTALGDAIGAFEAAWAAGIRYFDTAPFYGYTRSERRVGVLLGDKPRGDYRISTKVGRLMTPDAAVPAEEDGWSNPLKFRPVYDYSGAGIRRSFEASIHRLGLHPIDILYIHDIGRLTHGERHDHHWHQLTAGGGFRALEELRASGAISAFGLGVNEGEVIDAALDVVRLDVVMLAGRHTLLDQSGLAVMDRCRALGTSVVAAGPFNSGALAGGTHFDYGDMPPAVRTRLEALRAVAAEFAVALPAAAIQFPLAHPAVVSVVAGARNASQAAGNVAAMEAPIPADFWRALADRKLVSPSCPLPVGAP